MPRISESIDMVKDPPHYKNWLGVECVDIIYQWLKPEEVIGYFKGNVIKYLWRYENKGKPKQDLEKARRYIEMLEAYLESGLPGKDVE